MNLDLMIHHVQRRPLTRAQRLQVECLQTFRTPAELPGYLADEVLAVLRLAAACGVQHLSQAVVQRLAQEDTNA